jgi:hypothetical protein
MCGFIATLPCVCCSNHVLTCDSDSTNSDLCVNCFQNSKAFTTCISTYMSSFLCKSLKYLGDLFPHTLLALVLLQKLSNNVLRLVSASFPENLRFAR